MADKLFADLVADLRDSANILLLLASFLDQADGYLSEIEAEIFCLGLQLAGYRIKADAIKAFLTGSGGRG